MCACVRAWHVCVRARVCVCACVCVWSEYEGWLQQEILMAACPSIHTLLDFLQIYGQSGPQRIRHEATGCPDFT